MMLGFSDGVVHCVEDISGSKGEVLDCLFDVFGCHSDDVFGHSVCAYVQGLYEGQDRVNCARLFYL